MRDKRVFVVGAGPVGLAIALALQDKGMPVKIISEKLPGEGITGDLAAGIGSICQTKSQLVSGFILKSYQGWMDLAADSQCPCVKETRLITTDADTDPPWASQVAGFRRWDKARFEYSTYAFNPLALGQWRLARFKKGGGTVEQRPLTLEEVSMFRNSTVPRGCDYVVVTMGLELRDVKPEFCLYPVRGLLVHFPQVSDERSFEHAKQFLYVVNRPGSQVVGGTYDEYIGNISRTQTHLIAKHIIKEANREFRLNLDFDMRENITVGYRPATPNGKGVFQFGTEVAFINGLDKAGWMSGPELGRYVAGNVMEFLRR